MLRKTRLALATCVALAAPSAFERANARTFVERCELYNGQANPDYGFGPCVTAQPGDVVIGVPGRPQLPPWRFNGPWR